MKRSELVFDWYLIAIKTDFAEMPQEFCPINPWEPQTHCKSWKQVCHSLIYLFTLFNNHKIRYIRKVQNTSRHNAYDTNFSWDHSLNIHAGIEFFFKGN